MEPFIGEVKILPWDWAPKGWATCSGQLMAIAQNQALYALLGTQYGGDGRTTFALPDLRSRTAVHTGSNYPQGTATGTETVQLTISTMAMHTHMAVAVTDTAAAKQPAGHLFGTDTSTATDFLTPAANLVAMSPQAVSITGSGVAHPNIQPYLVLNYSIALQGYFPSRN